MGQYRMPFLNTPYVLVASQYDLWQLMFNLGFWEVNHTYFLDENMTAYAEGFANTTKRYHTVDAPSLRHV